MTADLTISRDLVRGGSRKSTNLRYNLKFTPIRGIQLTETIPLRDNAYQLGNSHKCLIKFCPFSQMSEMASFSFLNSAQKTFQESEADCEQMLYYFVRSVEILNLNHDSLFSCISMLYRKSQKKKSSMRVSKAFVKNNVFQCTPQTRL